VKDPHLDLESLPKEDQAARLRGYQAGLAAQREREQVEAALAVPPKERTSAQQAAIAYSRFGTAAGHP
jgi:hypothetical protein